VSPDVRDYDDLRGKTLAVDAIATGYSLVLQKLLQLGGLEDGDYRLEPVGSTATRAQALMENKFSGTILTTPLENRAGVAGDIGVSPMLSMSSDRTRRLSDHPAAAGRGPTATRLVSFIRASTEAIGLVVRSEEPHRGGGDLQDASAERARGRRAGGTSTRCSASVKASRAAVRSIRKG